MRKATSTRAGITFLLCLLWLLPLHVATAGNGSWTRIQPEGGVATSLVDAGSKLLLISSERIYSSTDDGQSWSLYAELPSYITSLDIARDDASFVVAGTGHHGVMRSTDGGSTWETPGLDEANWYDGMPVTDVLINEDRIYAATLENGVFVSVDGGETWNPTPGQPTDLKINELEVDPNAPGVIYAGTSNKGVFKTSDRGASWQWLTGSFKLREDYDDGEMNASVLTVVPGTSVIFAASIHGARIARSTDGGATWTTVSTSDSGLPMHSAAVRAIVPGSGGEIYAVFDSLYFDNDSPLYRSDDGGTTWVDLGQPVTGQLGPNGLSLHVADDGTVLFGGHRGIWQVAPDGSSWTKSNKGFHEVAIDKVARAHQESERIVAVGRNLFPYISNDGGKTWTDLDDGRIPTADFEAVGINPADDAEIWVGQAGDEGLLQSNDGGVTWTDELVGVAKLPSPWVTQIAFDPINPGTVLAVSESGELFITNDGGASWSVTWEGLPPARAYPFANGLEIAPSDPSIVYLATAVGLFRSADGGHTWESRVINVADESITALAVDPTDADVVFAGSENIGLWRSEDSGTSWSPAGPESARTMAIHPRDGNKLLVVGSHRVYASKDGGATWSNLTANLGASDATDVLFDPFVDNRYFVAANGLLAVYDGAIPDGTVIGRDGDDSGGDDSGGDDSGGDDSGDEGSNGGGGGGGALTWLIAGMLLSIGRIRKRTSAIRS